MMKILFLFQPELPHKQSNYKLDLAHYPQVEQSNKIIQINEFNKAFNTDHFPLIK